MSLRLWLIGGDVAASASPAMQEAALRAVGIAAEYTPMSVDAAGLAALLARLRAGAARGANVTMPHKQAVALACDELEGDAALLGAVNTVSVEAGRLCGESTDARGLAAALRHHGLVPPAGGRGVVLGAGGAALAAGLALHRLGCGEVDVAARRGEAAATAVARLSAAGVMARPLELTAGGLEAALGDAAILVNATPAGVRDLPLSVARLAPRVIVCDLRYRPRPVDLVAAARAAGLRSCDGLEMLLRQGMLSLQRWTGVEPSLEAGRSALTAALGR